jgi:hypothetical protein
MDGIACGREIELEHRERERIHKKAEGRAKLMLHTKNRMLYWCLGFISN